MSNVQPLPTLRVVADQQAAISEALAALARDVAEIKTCTSAILVLLAAIVAANHQRQTEPLAAVSAADGPSCLPAAGFPMIGESSTEARRG